MAVRVVADSSCGLPVEIVEELGITIVDLHVLSDDTRNTTSGLSALELCAVYARQLERSGDDGVVALHLAKELSATWSNAQAAAGVFDGAVRVIDTENIGMAVGAAAMVAATVAREGASLDRCEAAASDTLKRAETWLYLNRLDDLRRSGRLSAGTSMLSTALASKPIMHVNGGQIELAAKTRTRSKAFVRVVELVHGYVGEQPSFIVVQVSDARCEGQELIDMLREVLSERSSFMLCELDPALTVHTGPRAVGISVVRGVG